MRHHEPGKWISFADFFPMAQSINEDCQEFLWGVADAENFLNGIRTYLWNRVVDNFGDEECLTFQACALGIMAIDDFLKGYQVQIDKVLDGVPRETVNLEILIDCIEQSYALVCELDEIWESYDASDDATFYRLSQIQITLLEILARVPGWPDIETLKEQARIGKRALEEKRKGNPDAEEVFSEFRGFAEHIGTMLVRMVRSEREKALP